MPLILKPINSHFQVLLNETSQLSKQIEKPSTFLDINQIQALFKVCGNHGIWSSSVQQNPMYDTNCEYIFNIL